MNRGLTVVLLRLIWAWPGRPHCAWLNGLLSIQRASDGKPAAIQHMRVDHGGAYVFVPQ